MNTANSSPIENVDLAVVELQRQIGESIDRLSPERLHVLADFAAYLVNAENEAATQELLTIPGLLERVQQNQSTPKISYVNWRNIRADV
jgi:adenine specific DNA methylase Mod